MAYLYHLKPNGQAQCWIVQDKPVVAGRGDFADAFIEDDALSRSHFLIVREQDAFFVIDLHSSNGTMVDGEKVSARKLGEADFITAGDSSFYFSTTPVPADALPKPLTIPPLPAINSSLDAA